MSPVKPTLNPAAGMLARFTGELRELRNRAGNPSFREMAPRAHYSRSALAQVTNGQALPSLPLLLGFVQACGGEVERWRERWQQVHEALKIINAVPGPAASPWPYEAPADGVDPDAAGCTYDAITAHARRVALSNSRTVLGQVQLRYSPRVGAIWSRFEGFAPLDRTADQRRVEIEVEACRIEDNTTTSFRTDYQFDYHWSDLLLTGRGLVYAGVRLYFDGELAAAGQTDRLSLP